MAEEVVLGFLKDHDGINDSGEFAATLGVDHNELVNVIKSLHGFRIVDAQVDLSSSLFAFRSAISGMRAKSNN
ncbi:hypothetical protein EJ110_NYTH43797 [Nymphaea thermarum]|nr:hypothetical protein EJ110_NYTH43797 [Nymphaea thermarum]